MATKVFMEALSPTMEEGRLVKWLKNEGDAVKSGDTLAEVETDKAIMELVARGDGVLRKRLVDEGESRPVGTLVGVIAAADENIDALVARRRRRRAPRRRRRSRRAAAAAAPAAAGRSAGAAPQRRAARRRRAAAAPPQRRSGTAAAAAAQPTANGGQVRSSPLARRLASERGLDLSQRPGLRSRRPHHQARHRSRRQRRRRAAAAARRRPARSHAAATSRTSPLTQIRKTIAKRLVRIDRPDPDVLPHRRVRPHARHGDARGDGSRWATSSRCRSTTSS